MSTAFTSAYNSHLNPVNQSYQTLSPVSFAPSGQYASSSAGTSASNRQTGLLSDSQINVEPNASLKKPVNLKRTPEEVDCMEQTGRR